MSRAYCPSCDEVTDRQVKQTNMVPEDKAVYRRNRCPNCGVLYMTSETPCPTDPSKMVWHKFWELEQ